MGQIAPVGRPVGHPRTQCPFCGVPAQDAHPESNPEETDKPKSGTYKKTDLSSPKMSRPWTSSTKLLQTGKTLRTLTSPHNRAHMLQRAKAARVHRPQGRRRAAVLVPGCILVARENILVCRYDGHQVGSLFPSGSERKSFALCLQCEFETVSRFRIDGKAKEARDNEAHCTVPAHRTSWNGDVHLWWQGRVSVSWGRVGSTTKGHQGGFCGKEDSP